VTIQRFVIQVLGWGLGLPLEILVIIALLHGAYRRYPVVFTYVLAIFVTTLVQIPFLAQMYFTHDAEVIRQGAMVYWISEWILQVLIFMTVLSLIDQATALSRSRRAMRFFLSAGALLFAGISFWVHYRPLPVKFGLWMTPWTRDLSLCATVLDLGLWMILIASRKSDRALLLICGALGMQFTAEAIGEAIVQLSAAPQSQTLALAGAAIAVAGNLICFYVWWQTFRGMPRRVEAVR
jgi:hypothetical protein